MPINCEVIKIPDEKTIHPVIKIPDEKTIRYITYPRVVVSYIQLCLNMYLVLSTVFIYRNFVDMIGNDISQKINFHRETHSFWVESCSRNYLENKCFGKDHLPALTDLCREWDTCIKHTSPNEVSSSTVTAKIIADTLNSFFEHLTYKTVFIVSVATFTSIVSLNMGLGYIN